MVIPSKIEYKYLRTGLNTVLERLHIIVGDDISLEKGDTIILPSKNSSRIEIKKKKDMVPKDFKPYYM